MDQKPWIANVTKPAIALAQINGYLQQHWLQPFQYVMGIKSTNSTQNARRFKRHWLWRRLRYLYCRFVRLKGHPDAIARGLAAGVFAGCFPIFGFQMLIGGTLAALLRGNIPLALAGTWISNPATYIPIFVFNFHVGTWILNSSFESLAVTQSLKELVALGADFALIPLLKELVALGADFAVPLFLGCTIVGAICAIGSYILGAWFIRYARHRRRTRQTNRSPS